MLQGGVVGPTMLAANVPYSYNMEVNIENLLITWRGSTDLDTEKYQYQNTNNVIEVEKLAEQLSIMLTYHDNVDTKSMPISTK